MPRTIVYIGNGLPDRTAGALRIMANVKALQAGGYNVVLINEMDKTNNRLNPTHIQGFETYNIYIRQVRLNGSKGLSVLQTS